VEGGVFVLGFLLAQLSVLGAGITRRMFAFYLGCNLMLLRVGWERGKSGSIGTGAGYRVISTIVEGRLSGRILFGPCAGLRWAVERRLYAGESQSWNRIG
jgi:hypothetical protein